MNAPTEKRCFKCGEVKILSAFYKHPKMADGHVNKCKECNKKDVTKNRLDNLEYVQEYDRNRRKKGNVSDERWEELSTKRRIYYEAYYAENPDKWEEHLAKSRKENCSKEQWARILESKVKYLTENSELRAQVSRKYRERNPKKYKAHSLVGNAIRAGKLSPEPCEVCGDVKVHGHHCDYDKPLEVMWLCAEHHSLWHRLNGEGLNADVTK